MSAGAKTSVRTRSISAQVRGAVRREGDFRIIPAENYQPTDCRPDSRFLLPGADRAVHVRPPAQPESLLNGAVLVQGQYALVVFDGTIAVHRQGLRSRLAFLRGKCEGSGQVDADVDVILVSRAKTFGEADRLFGSSRRHIQQPSRQGGSSACQPARQGYPHDFTPVLVGSRPAGMAGINRKNPLSFYPATGRFLACKRL